VPEARLNRILAAEDPEAASAELQAAFREGLEARTPEQKRAALAALEEDNRLAEAAKLGYVRAEADPATGETRHRFTGTDGATSVHATREGALREMEVWQAMQSVKDMKTLRRAAERGQMQHLAAPGMRSEGAQVSDEAREMVTGDPAAEEVVGTEAMESRIALSVLQQRAYTGDAGGAQGYRVRAMRYAKQTLDGAYQGVIRFFKGRDIADVFEEFSEDALARGLSEGLVDGTAVLRDLRKVEHATGMELLPPGYGIDPAAGEVDTMPLLEGFSKLARAHAWGNVRTGALPERTARWMDMLVATQAGMLRKAENTLIRSDLARAGQFKEALAKGEVPAELEKLLGESIGIGKVPEGAGPEVFEQAVLSQGSSQATFSVDPLRHPNAKVESLGREAGPRSDSGIDLNQHSKKGEESASRDDVVGRAFTLVRQELGSLRLRPEGGRRKMKTFLPGDSLPAYRDGVTKLADAIRKSNEDVAGPLRDHAIDIANAAMGQGKRGVEWLMAALRKTEASSGESVLTGNILSLAGDPRRRVVVATFAKLAIDHTLGRSADVKLPAELLPLFRVVKETASAALAVADGRNVNAKVDGSRQEEAGNEMAFREGATGEASNLVSASKPDRKPLAGLGWSSSRHYRTLFFKAYPDLRRKVWVHHAVEKQIITRYPGLFSKEEIQSLENLRGIPKHLNREIHLIQIRLRWNDFYRENPRPSREDVLRHATKIDTELGSNFNPPV
jgi:hypothetical protein